MAKYAQGISLIDISEAQVKKHIFLPLLHENGKKCFWSKPDRCGHTCNCHWQFMNELTMSEDVDMILSLTIYKWVNNE